MDYKSAAEFPMPFGQHKGRKLDDIAIKDEGLLYLDWLRGERKGKDDQVDRALAAYLDNDTIASEVRRAIEAKS